MGYKVWWKSVIITKSDLNENEDRNDEKIIDKLNVNIKDFNYNSFQNSSKSAYKINDPDGYTNLRKEKNTTSTVLEKIETGQIVELIEKSGDWYLVKTKAGNEGYVFKTKIVAKWIIKINYLFTDVYLLQSSEYI